MGLLRHLTILLIAYAASARAETAPDLETRLQSLESEIANLKARPAWTYSPLTNLNERRTELGPAASKIYFREARDFEIALSAEVFTFQEKRGTAGTASAVNRANVLSVSPVLAFRPHPRVIFNSQLLIENGGAESSNTVAVRKGQSIVLQAYIDWLSSEKGESGVRVGHQLIPVGLTNAGNEPSTYFGVLKPELERELISASWHENGITFWVDRPRADIQLGIYNSLDYKGFRGETFLAGGRSQGQNAAADDPMVAGRINLKWPSLTFGGSIAFGNSSQGDPNIANAGFRMLEAHALARLGRLRLQGMLAYAEVDDADAISILNSTVMGSAARGKSFEAAFDVAGGVRPLWLFARYSDYNLQEEVSFGYNADPAQDRAQITLGASYLPLPGLIVKADYAFRDSAGADVDDELALGLGFSY